MRKKYVNVSGALCLSACLLGALFLVPEYCSAADPATTQSSDADDTAVRTGREALSAPPDRFPWYDAEHDSLRRVELGPAKSAKSTSGRHSSRIRWRHGSHYNGKGSGRGGNASGEDGGDDDSAEGDSSDDSRDDASSSRDARDDSSDSPSISMGSADATWLVWLAWVAIGAALVALAYYLIRAFLNREARAAKNSQSTAADDEPTGIEALPAALPLPKGDLWSEIERLYQAGDYNRAIIYLYAYQLIKLDQHQCIHLAKGKTNRVYVQELSSRLELQGLLARTMIPFESVFFGGHPLDRQGFEACWREAETFRQLAEQAVA
jgi:hypothetical protein